MGPRKAGMLYKASKGERNVGWGTFALLTAQILWDYVRLVKCRLL